MISSDKERKERRERRLNQRGESPKAWEQDPYLSSAGDGPGVWLDDEDREADD